MTRLGLIPCLGAALALPGCIVNYDLGETAEDTSDGSGEGTGGETGAGTDPDPSATSGQPGTTDPSAEGTGQVPEPTDDGPATATDGDTDGDTDGEPLCDHDPDYVRWQFNGQDFSPLEGIEPQFLAILQGGCTVGEITVVTPEVGDPTWSVPLSCAVEGQLDGDAGFAGDLALVVDMTGTVTYGEVVSTLGQSVRLKLVLDWWGMGWNGWLVLEDEDDGDELLDLVEAEYVDPYESTWTRQVGDVFGGPWRSNLSVSVADDECGGSAGQCNDEPRSLQVGIGPDWYLQLHEGQEGTMSNDALFLLYRASVTSARAIPEPTCTDLPSATYASAIWMQEQ